MKLYTLNGEVLTEGIECAASCIKVGEARPLYVPVFESSLGQPRGNALCIYARPVKTEKGLALLEQTPSLLPEGGREGPVMVLLKATADLSYQTGDFRVRVIAEGSKAVESLSEGSRYMPERLVMIRRGGPSPSVEVGVKDFKEGLRRGVLRLREWGGPVYIPESVLVLEEVQKVLSTSTPLTAENVRDFLPTPN